MNVKDIIENGGNPNSETGPVSEPGFNAEYEAPRRGLSFLKVPSLDKPLEEYLNHPLNIAKDEDFGQGLRGIEAYLGNTNLAIIDLFGFIKYFFKNKSKKVEVNNADQSNFM